MTTQTAATSVQRAMTVQAPIERAFEVFTVGMPTWWPEDHHLLDGFERMVVEPHVGGHIYDVAGDGRECHWSRVLAYEPPHRFVFSWDISPRWEIESDPEKTSEVEIRFTAEDAGRTRVELEHRNLDRHGEGWEAMRDAVGSPNGWSLERFAAAAASAE